jgi:hypothetical protein
MSTAMPILRTDKSLYSSQLERAVICVNNEGKDIGRGYFASKGFAFQAV